MRSILLVLLLALLNQAALAALPPHAQNDKDLEVMLSFVRGHERVLATLDAIDLRNLSVRYGQGCTAHFGRESRFRLPGWVGPAAVLQFESSDCPLD